MELTCPKCQAPMRQYERNGVTVDQCTECRGLFLDRGELEKLVDAENQFYDEQSAPRSGAPAPAQPQAQQPPPVAATQPFPQYDQIPPQAAPYHAPYRRYGSPDSPDSPNFYGGRPRYDQYGRRRKKSFLSELFD